MSASVDDSVRSAGPPASPRPMDSGKEGFHQLFGLPDSSIEFIFLYDYPFSVASPIQPKVIGQNPFTTFKQISAAQARLHRQPGIQQFDEFFSSLPDKIPDSCGIAFRYINNNAITSIHDILSPNQLGEHTNRLVNFIGRDGVSTPTEMVPPPKYAILVGHGYGGLICEQAFMLLETASTSSTDSRTLRAKQRLRGMLLVNTPHFRVGLAEWTLLAANELNIKTAKHRQKQKWSKSSDHFRTISDMQTKLADIFEKSESEIRIACCFAKLPDSVSELRLSPEFCCLPHVEAIEIHDSSHFSFNSTSELDGDLEYIISRLATWAKDISAGKKPVHDPLPLRSLAGSSRANDPTWKWDPKSLDQYFMLSWKGKTSVSAESSIAIGDIIKETNDLDSPIATLDDVMSSQKGDLVDFGLSHVVKNNFDRWKSLFSTEVDEAGFNFIVREEWSKDRSIEYVKAALQRKDVRESLKHTKSTFYVVTGVIRGSRTADSDSSERSKVLGYKCRQVSVRQQSEQQADSIRLVVEQVEARSMNQTTAVKFTPTVTEELLPEVEHAEKLPLPRALFEKEQESKKQKDMSRKIETSKGRRRKAVRNVLTVVSIMGNIMITQIAGRG